MKIKPIIEFNQQKVKGFESGTFLTMRKRQMVWRSAISFNGRKAWHRNWGPITGAFGYRKGRYKEMSDVDKESQNLGSFLPQERGSKINKLEHCMHMSV